MLSHRHIEAGRTGIDAGIWNSYGAEVRMQEERQKIRPLFQESQLEAATPSFLSPELRAILNQLDEDNHIMFRDGVIHII